MEKDRSLVEVGSLTAEVESRQLEGRNLRFAEGCSRSLEVEGKVMEDLDVRSWAEEGTEVAVGNNLSFDGRYCCRYRCNNRG